jgi:hypothetical protein
MSSTDIERQPVRIWPFVVMVLVAIAVGMR